jgi:transporter family protein
MLFAAFVAIFAKVGLQEVDSDVATALRAIVMTVFIIGFILAIGKI